MRRSRVSQGKPAAPPKELFKAAAEMFKAASKGPSSADKLSKSLNRCAVDLDAGSARMRERFGDACDVRLVDALAEQCALLSDALDSMGGFEKLGTLKALVATGEVVEGTVGLSRILVSIADTIGDEAPDAKMDPAPTSVRDEFGRTAHGMFQAALALGHSAGFLLTDTVFVWPQASRCGCGGRRTGSARLAGQPPEIIAAAELGSPELDRTSVGLAYREVLEELLKLLVLLALLARFLPLMLAYFDEYYYQACSQDCTGPSGRIISITRTASYSSQDSRSTPLADADVELCCSNTCMIVSTEWDVETVAVPGVVVGASLGVGREAAAAGIAGGAAALATLRRKIRAAPPACP